MGLMDSIKNMVSGKKPQIKDGIDKGAGAIGDKAGTHKDKVDKGADMAKDAVDKLPE